MREYIHEFVQICAQTLPINEPIYEFGSLQTPGQEGWADLRPFFPGAEYVGCDMREGPGVDKVLNLHDIDLPAGVAGTVLLTDTLEHVEFVRRAVEEVHRILKPNGLLIASSVMKFPIHSFPNDYWRFTPEAFKSLFRPFESSFVEFAGKKRFPHTVVGVAFKGPMPHDGMDNFRVKVQLWKTRWRRPPGRIRKGLVKLVTHPLSLDVYKKFRCRRHGE